MDGWITIGTKLETDKFDKQVRDLEDKIKKEESKAELKLQAKLQAERELEAHKQKIYEVEKEYEKLSQQVEKVQGIMDKQGKGIALTPQDFTDMQNYDSILAQSEKIGNSLDKMYTKQDQLNAKVQRTNFAYNETADKVNKYKQKLDSIKLDRQVADVNRMKEGFKGVGSSVQSAIKKVGKLALGIFAVRSAYNLLRQASSNLASYDEQYATNLEYIKYALTQAIAPVLQYIVSLAATLLGYINAIINALFGINLFSKGSADNFNKMKAGASGAAKAAKEIRKQLAGFDEINMLSDQSDSGGGAGGAGGATPSFDLSALGGEVPDWLKWIVDHKDEILALMAGVAAGLGAWKLGFSGLQSLGIGVAIGSLVYAIEKLIGFMNDPSFENFGGTIQGIGGAITGLAIAFGGLYGIIAGVVVLIVGTVLKYWEQIKGTIQKGLDWLKSKTDWVSFMFGDTFGKIYNVSVEALQNVLDFFDFMFTSWKGQFEGIIMFLEGVFTGDWNKAWEGIQKGFTAWWEGIKGMIDSLFKYFDNVLIQPLKIVFASLWNGIMDGFRTAVNWIQQRFNDMISFFNRVIGIINGLFAYLGTQAGEIIGGNFKRAINVVLGVIEKILNSPIRAINSLISTINTLPGVNLSRLNTFSLPRLAVGGIVNMPNRGTMVGGAIAGESGREGVLPLTDQEAMAELGREIGKWININATVPVYVGNRQIAREIKKINAEDDFAYNT